jgi:hypothetical protein
MLPVPVVPVPVVSVPEPEPVVSVPEPEPDVSVPEPAPEESVPEPEPVVPVTEPVVPVAEPVVPVAEPVVPVPEPVVSPGALLSWPLLVGVLLVSAPEQVDVSVPLVAAEPVGWGVTVVLPALAVCVEPVVGQVVVVEVEVVVLEVVTCAVAPVQAPSAPLAAPLPEVLVAVGSLKLSLDPKRTCRTRLEARARVLAVRWTGWAGRNAATRCAGAEWMTGCAAVLCAVLQRERPEALLTETFQRNAAVRWGRAGVTCELKLVEACECTWATRVCVRAG